MSREKTRLQVVSRRPAAVRKAHADGGRHASGRQDASGKKGREKPQLVSGRWLLVAICVTIAAAVFCGWLGLCLLFWQGSWQLLYHPAGAVARTPGSAGLAFDPVAFAVTDTGVPRLRGWWIPATQGARQARFTVVYLHGADGNLGDTVDALVRLHGVGVNVLAFDYRGYGASQFARPSERNWRQDVDWALDYLTGTRQVDSGTIVLDGTGLGANLALEACAEHLELAGVVVDSPIDDPAGAIFNDARARHVAMQRLDLVAGFVESFGELFGHHHAAVLAAGASEGDGQVALAFFDVMREQVEHELGTRLRNSHRLRKSATYAATLGSRPVFLRNSGTKWGWAGSAHRRPCRRRGARRS
jgi:pimeloyl-ACP methyl ester carboxylesterase